MTDKQSVSKKALKMFTIKLFNLAEVVKEGADREVQVARRNRKNHAQNARDRAIENAHVIVKSHVRRRARRIARCKLTM